LGFPTGWSFTTHQLSALLLIDINVGFLTEGKLAAILITPSSWGSQRAGHSPRNKQQVFWRRCWGRVEDFCKGSFSHAHPLLCFIVFLYFIYFTCIAFISKNPKKIESLVVVFTCLL
jgi:hypothetical protein